MREIAKKTFFRAGIAVLVAVLLAEFLVWWPVRKSKELIHSQLALTQEAMKNLNQAEAILKTLPDISTVGSKIGDAKTYADQAKNTSNQFQALSFFRPPSVKPIFGISSSKNADIIETVNQIIDQIKQGKYYRSTRQDLASVDSLLAYHAAVSQALVNILEYDPVADTQGFDLNSADTQKRLQLAHDGLIKTDQQLQAAKKLFNDSSINEITAVISGLRYERYQLSQTGDTNTWISAVQSAQNTIRANRVTFWHNQAKVFSANLQIDHNFLNNAYGLWGTAAKQYSVS